MVICLIIVLKLAVTVFTSQYIRTLYDHIDLIFFGHLKKNSVHDQKNPRFVLGPMDQMLRMWDVTVVNTFSPCHYLNSVLHTSLAAADAEMAKSRKYNDLSYTYIFQLVVIETSSVY